MKKSILFMGLMVCALPLLAQQYTGTTGLIQTPSAEMNAAGDARLGVHFINKELLPNCKAFTYEGRKYHSFSHYLSLTPFSWMEIGYACTLLKRNSHGGDVGGYGAKDRYFSVKLQPLREGKYWPAVAVGGNDFMDSRSSVAGDGGEIYYGNYYVAATKHVQWHGTEIGVTAAYRHYLRDYNDRWEGVVGGITVRPAFARQLRGIVEYNGDQLNVGADCLLWKHLLMQVSVTDGKYVSGGLAYQLNLF